MNGWVKHFRDGTKYYGYDQDVSIKKASWTNSRHEGLVGVTLWHSDFMLAIDGLGEYWQSDQFTVDFAEPTPTLISRRIQKKTEGDFAYIVKSSSSRFCVETIKPGTTVHNPAALLLPQPGWLTLELNVKEASIRHFFSDTKL